MRAASAFGLARERRDEQVVLAPEVAVQRAERDPRVRGHVAQAHGLEAALFGERDRRRHDPLLAFLHGRIE